MNELSFITVPFRDFISFRESHENIGDNKDPTRIVD